MNDDDKTLKFIQNTYQSKPEDVTTIHIETIDRLIYEWAKRVEDLRHMMEYAPEYKLTARAEIRGLVRAMDELREAANQATKLDLPTFPAHQNCDCMGCRPWTY